MTGTVTATTEAAWQEQVLELAELLGWNVMHVRRSIGRGQKWTTSTSVSGWPDVFAWHERQHRVLAVELKSERGKLTPEQRQVLASLELAGVEVHVWRPSDFDTAHAVLAGRSDR